MTNTPHLRGRERELAAVADLIAAARRGQSSFLLVAGRAGFGKSRFLRAAVDLARAADFRVGIGGAEDGGQAVPMMTLLSVLFSGPEPLLERATLRELPSAPEQRFWLVQELAGLLEAAALGGPLLVCVDDLQWADPGTLAALRSLPGQLADLPILWIVAHRVESSAADMLATLEQFDALGSRRLTLGHLEKEAALLVAADMLGADPDPRLLQLVTSTDGNPFLLVELLSGLLGEGRVHVDGTTAHLSGTGLPARLRESMRARLDQRSAPARELACVAAVLGRRFTHDQLTAMLGGSTAALLRPIEELLRAGIIVEDDQQLAFGHDLVREAVLDATPVSSRRALQRRAVDVFLAEGALPVEVARQLAESAPPGDRPAISLLSRAAEALKMSDSTVAAELAVKALELAAPDDAMRGPLVAQAAVLLLAAGRSSEGQVLAQGALGDLLPPQQRAEVSLTIAEITSIPADIREQACRSVLELRGLPDVLRLRLQARLAYSLAHEGTPVEARQVLDTIGQENTEIEDQASWWTVQVTERSLELMDDRFGAALDGSARLRRTGHPGKPLHAIHADYVLAEALSLRDDFDDALQITGMFVAAAQRDDQIWVASTFERQRGRLWAAAGRLDDAAAALERVSAGLEPNQVANTGDAAALTALGRVALHTGNHHQSELCAQIAKQATDALPTEPRRHVAWLLAMQRMAEGHPDAARTVLTQGRESAMSAMPTCFIDPADPPHLVRIALACGDRHLADEAARIAERRHERNPGVASLQAIAAHARGLRDGDVEEIARAVRYFGPSPRRLALASAVEDYGRLLVLEGRKAEGITELGEALKLYVAMGATWDATRLRARLRRLGVRRNLQPARPADGWAGLTDSEIGVVRLVAEGKTNREVAARLYLSPYTVNTHLRHVFTKLGIRSRVDLVRLFVLHQDALA